VRRFLHGGEFIADMIWDEVAPRRAGNEPVIVDPLDPTRRKKIPEGSPYSDLLVPVFRGGRCVYEPPPATSARALAQSQLAGFHGGIKRFVNPHIHPVGLERGLYDFKTRLILEKRGVPA
jgi:nicotinate phosphoribosyltransferase